jgi:ABC-type sulfate transport system permease component
MNVYLSDFLISEALKNPHFVLGLMTALLFLIALLLIAIFIRKNRSDKADMSNSATSVKPALFTTALTGGASSLTSRSMSELLAIEESLMALRELYHRKLISSEIYVEESMKHSAQL